MSVETPAPTRASAFEDGTGRPWVTSAQLRGKARGRPGVIPVVSPDYGGRLLHGPTNETVLITWTAEPDPAVGQCAGPKAVGASKHRPSRPGSKRGGLGTARRRYPKMPCSSCRPLAALLSRPIAPRPKV